MSASGMAARLPAPKLWHEAKPGVIVVMSRGFAGEIAAEARKLAPAAEILLYTDLLSRARCAPGRLRGIAMTIAAKTAVEPAPRSRRSRTTPTSKRKSRTPRASCGATRSRPSTAPVPAIREGRFPAPIFWRACSARS